MSPSCLPGTFRADIMNDLLHFNRYDVGRPPLIVLREEAHSSIRIEISRCPLVWSNGDLRLYEEIGYDDYDSGCPDQGTNSGSGDYHARNSDVASLSDALHAWIMRVDLNPAKLKSNY